MTANLGEDGTEPSPEFLPDAARNFEHGAISLACQGGAKDGQNGKEAGGESIGQMPRRDTSAEVYKTYDDRIHVPMDLARQNLRPRTRKLDIHLQFSDQDEGRCRETEEDFEDRDGAIAEVGSAPHQAFSEGWESFLPQRQLRVLLVEDDDSTRHVVAALLRNCSYEVTSAGNGLQAWELLEGPNNHFDLVLTDVVMPCLSGVGLLSRIMSREAGKRLPVVMMSSHDSMDIVFRCLSKGAADYLVKPVRKNELKNLWQHVWRKCHSSSGSGSGSGSQTGKVIRPKRRAGSGNNSGSNDGSDHGSSGLNLRGGSDNGSGTQSSWTERVVEVESPQQAGGRDFTGHPNGTGLKSEFTALQSRMEELKGLRPGKKKEGHNISQDKANGFSEGELPHEIEPSAPRSPGAELEGGMIDVAAFNNGDTVKAVLDSKASEVHEDELNDKDPSMSLSKPSDEHFPEAMDLTAVIASQLQGGVDNPGNSGEGDDLRAINSSVTKNSNSMPTLELSLKRSRAAGDADADADDRHILRQSGGSAFSRYSTTVANISQQFISGNCLLHGYPLSTGFGGHSISPGGPGTSNTGLVHEVPKDRPGSSKGSGEVSTPVLVHPSLSNNCNGQDMSSSVVGPSGRDVFSGPRPVKDEAVSLAPMSGQKMSLSVPLPSSGMLPYDGRTAAYGPTIHQVFYSHPGTSPWATSSAQLAEREAFDHATFHELSHPQAHRHPHHQTVQHHHDHDHQHQHSHHHHHHGTLPQPPAIQQREDQILACAGANGVLRCGSSNAAGNLLDGCNGQSGSSNCHGSNGNGNGSVNGSASGSNNFGKGNNGHSNGQSVAHAAVLGNGDSGNVSGHGDCGTNNLNHGNSGNGSGSGNPVNGGAFAVGPEAVKFSRREAALNKFRQKRKERCFEKKVRYQSRKRLAEQRPRVRGQFVRQVVYEIAGEVD